MRSKTLTDPPKTAPNSFGHDLRRNPVARFPKFYLALFVVGLICTPHGLNADMAPLQVKGGAAAARGPHETIRMESEEVTIRLEKASYMVDAVFHFSNSGETTTEWVGFPKGGEYFEATPKELPGFDRAPDRFPDFVQFHTWVDGNKVPFSAEGSRWLARQVTFPGHATTIIRVVYEANYYRGSYAEYIIGTGSYWKDSIGMAAFTVDGSAVGGSKNFSANLDAPQIQRLLTEKALRLEVKDYKPEPNVRLGIHISRPREAFPR
jgi:hypothetical protein